jgi:N utilization substance protein B
VQHSGSNHGRVRARRCAVQALYQWIVTRASPSEIVGEFVADRELIKVDIDYFSELTREVPSRFQDLLTIIKPTIDRDWAQIGPVEQSILLIGTYELRFCPQVPWRVVLNEGVELCKMFGPEDAHKYINGVLDKVARQCREIEITGNPTVNI